MTVINESVAYIVDYAIHDPSYPPLVKMFIVIGVITFTMTLLSNTGKFIEAMFYIIGIFKWLFKSSRADILQILSLISPRRLITNIKLRTSFLKKNHDVYSSRCAKQETAGKIR